MGLAITVIVSDPPKGTANAPIQICWPSPAVSLPPRCGPESFPSRAAFAEIDESPTLAIAILRGLADSDSCLRRLAEQPTITKQNVPITPRFDNAVGLTGTEPAGRSVG